MFKQIIHYFASKSLEKHRINTQCMIEEYELDAAKSKTRIEAKARDYASKLKNLSSQREKELNGYIQFLNKNLTNATEYIPKLKLLQKMIFVCLDDWMNKSLCEQNLRLQSSKYQILASSISLLDTIKKEILMMSQQKVRQKWCDIVSSRPPRVSTPRIDELFKQFAKKNTNNSKAYDHDLQRINSHKNLLRKQLQEIKFLQSQIKINEVKPAQEKFFKSKQELIQIYKDCLQGWNDLQDGFGNYYRNTSSKSELANKWISEMQYGGTIHEIKQLIIDTASLFEEAKNCTLSLRRSMASVKERISYAYEIDDFSNIDDDKEERGKLYQLIGRAYQSQSEIYEARKVFFDRRNEINKYLELIKHLHPANTIEQVFKLFSQDSPDIYWKAIGLRTNNISPSARSQL